MLFRIFKTLKWVSNSGLMIAYMITLICIITCVILVGRTFDFTIDAISILTCFLTLCITATIGLKPLNFIMSQYNRLEFKEENKLRDEIESLKGKNEDYLEQIKTLKGEKIALNNRISTMQQSQQLVPHFNFDRAILAFKVSKSGFVVKEEPLLKCTYVTDFHQNCPKPKWFWQDNSKWQVFYADCTTYEYAIGIHLDSIEYAVNDDNILYFRNIELQRIDRIGDSFTGKNASELQEDINYTWIIKKNQREEYKIINNNNHRIFKREYCKKQKWITGTSIEREIDNLCNQWTKGLINVLYTRYGNQVVFINKNSPSSQELEWKPLSIGLQSNRDVMTLINDMYLAFDTMSLTSNNSKILDQTGNIKQIQS